MADRVAGFWRYRALYLFFAAALTFLQLLPLHPGPGQLPGPDVLLVLTLSWVVIRPDLLPVFLVAFVFLLMDLLLTRPPGLWAALTVLACEFVRSRRVLLRNAPFLIEWLLIASVVTAMTVAQTLILTIFAVPQPAFGLTVIRLVFSILAYPIVVLLLGRALGLSKASGERESLGGRL